MTQPTLDDYIEFSSSRFRIARVTDTFVLLADAPDCIDSLSANIENVLVAVGRVLGSGMQSRRVFFRNQRGRWEEILCPKGVFAGYASVGADQARFFERFI